MWCIFLHSHSHYLPARSFFRWSSYCQRLSGSPLLRDRDLNQITFPAQFFAIRRRSNFRSIVSLRRSGVRQGWSNQLLSAIKSLDYPADKLDVIIAVEADCHDTRAAITARKHRIPVTVIPVSPGEPRAKPKALSVALPLARGEYTVIYDAEDRPEPNQLRVAVQAFRSGGGDLACVQARLHMDSNTSWHARYFTAEYAGHFDFFLPRLAAFGLPLPLGGSSNHFRTQTLRAVGGWDPYNVTEDADLGMRLARFGYRCGVINSTTHEEAPAKIHRWLGQRSRWFKGWMRLSSSHFFLVSEA